MSSLSPDMPWAVILTANPVEFKAVKAHLTDLREKTHPEGTVYEIGKFKIGKFPYSRSRQVALAEIGAGGVDAAVETKRAIDYFKPEVLLFVGVAGGIKDVKLGDVVAATKVYGYESGKVVEGAFLPRPNVGLVSYRLEQRARAEARKDHWLERIKAPVRNLAEISWTIGWSIAPVRAELKFKAVQFIFSRLLTPQAFVGALAAGEKVVASTKSEVYQLFRDSYSDALAVEMESHGVLKAVRANPEINALIVRGISDLIDKKSEADAAGLQEIAARHASAFAFQVLAKIELEKIEAEKIYLSTAFLISIGAAVLVIFFRCLGLLQPFELFAYDLLMSWRRTEKIDNRVVIVKITKDDLKATKPKAAEIPYEYLLALLKALKSHYKAKIIGLDVYVDNPLQREGLDEIVRYLAKEEANDIITPCVVIPKYIYDENGYPPELIPGAIYPKTRDGNTKIPYDRLGFTNVPTEDFFGFNFVEKPRFIRRYQLTFDKNYLPDPSSCKTCCNTYLSLGLLVSLTYLQSNKEIEIFYNQEGYIELKQNAQKTTILKKLGEYGGGYRCRNIDGYEVLLNYRSRPSQNDFNSFNAKDIIAKTIETSSLENKIVLIGYARDIPGQYSDSYYTPGKLLPIQRMAGVVIHAHLVSQILSSVLENRPQLSVYPPWVDKLWIGVSSLIGGVFLGWMFQFNKRKLLLGIVIVSIVLVTICLKLLEYQGFWAPLVPQFMVLVLAAWTVGKKHLIVNQLKKQLMKYLR